jgi:hypothetical protein
MAKSSKIYVFSTLANDQNYTNWLKGGGDVPIKGHSVLIKGGTGVANDRLITPMGISTEINELDLSELENNVVFQKHKASGFIVVKQKAADPEFIERELANICASYQHVITEYLINRFFAAAQALNIRDLALAGGVSANSELRRKFLLNCEANKHRAFTPSFEYCTDNAAMIGISAYYKFVNRKFSDLKVVPLANIKI